MSEPTLNNQLCFALYSASNHLTGVYRSLLEPLDITYTQYIVLMALWEADSVSITGLAERTGLSKATMTPLLKRMEKKQLIQRQLIEGNERQKNIVLTKIGRDLSECAGGVAEKAFAATGLSEKQSQKMMKLCQIITTNTAKIDKP